LLNIYIIYHFTSLFSGSPPADPFTTTSNNQRQQESPPSLKTENWLEQHFRQAITLSHSSSALACEGLPPSMILPRSATMDLIQHPVKPTNDIQQLRQSWTQFSQQQSPKVGNWLNDSVQNKNPSIDSSLPPLQPLPPLPSFGTFFKILN
jgi:hypothetical protein